MDELFCPGPIIAGLAEFGLGFSTAGIGRGLASGDFLPPRVLMEVKLPGADGDAWGILLAGTFPLFTALDCGETGFCWDDGDGPGDAGRNCTCAGCAEGAGFAGGNPGDTNGMFTGFAEGFCRGSLCTFAKGFG